MNPIFYIDFYKLSHVSDYHSDVQQVFSNFTARSSRIPGSDKITNFGLTYFLKKYMIEEFDEKFFAVPIADVLKEYRRVIKATMFDTNPRTDHIEALHALGYMPLTFYQTPEGSQVPLNVPPIVIKNTEPGPFYWLPNYIETILSDIMWLPITSATTARRYRELFLKHARRAGETDFGFIDWQGHDFSFRGMGGLEAAILSGMGHLLSFSGTDTLPAILAAEEYYGASLDEGQPIVGGSVPATEHSVMCAGGQDGEFETFKRLLTEIHPSGILSIVSDTWDLWKVLTQFVPDLREILDARDGKLVIRPDSGNPVMIMCGDTAYDTAHGSPQAMGVLRLLAQAMGTHERGNALPLIGKSHPLFLNTVAAIYGDSISLERADQILTRCIDEIKLSPYNCVFGIGSFTYQMVTRDTYGMAMKATAYKNRKGEIIPIFKKPVTDDGGKFSHKGIPVVDFEDGVFEVQQESEEWELDRCAFEKVFCDGKLLVDPNFHDIRARVRKGL